MRMCTRFSVGLVSVYVYASVSEYVCGHVHPGACLAATRSTQWTQGGLQVSQRVIIGPPIWARVRAKARGRVRVRVINGHREAYSYRSA